MSKHILICVTALCFFVSCSQMEKNSYDIIPYPNTLSPGEGHFVLNDGCKIVFPAVSDSLTRLVARQFVDQFQKTSGILLIEEIAEEQGARDNSITFIINENRPVEGYMLDIAKNKIRIEASGAPGFFYAIQTIKQLLPAAVYGNVIVPTDWNLPCVKIEDAPRFKYRGMHMDVARHFFDINEVKRYIDILAVYKLNTLHWHLTDDQGWRIEIESYPRLTEYGSIRKKTMIKKEWETYDHTPYGGFFTKEEVRDVVAYAAERFITVIPEIDLPGHMLAAMACYPELGCTGGPYEVSGQWGVRDDVLCAGKESTFTFVENVLTEVMELFPSEYIHIGGDESPKIRWEKCPRCQAKIKELGLRSDDKHTAEHYLQSYVTARVEKFLNDHGRRIIGWDEILEGQLAPNATVMSWRGVEGGIEAARLGHDVIMTPTSYMYFDYYQSLDTENEPFGIGGYVPIEKVYSFDPIPASLQENEKKHIIGVQANLWSEYILTNEHLEYMLLPRLAALSEVQWTQIDNKEWSRFLNSLDHQTKIYDVMGYNYAKHIYEVSASYGVNPEKQAVEVVLQTQGNAPVYLTTDGTEPTEKSTLYQSPVAITHSCTLKAIVKREGVETRTFTKSFLFNKATGKELILNTNPKDKYTYAGASVLVDGIRGDFNYANGCWLGYLDEPLDVTLTFRDPEEISTVKMGTLIQLGEWIFPPVKIEVYGSEDGSSFLEVYKEEIPLAKPTDTDGLKEYDCSFEKKSVKKLRIVMHTTSKIPDWHGAKGNKGFLFVDEIMAE